MSSFSSRIAALILMVTLAGVVACNAGESATVSLPNPAVDATLATAKTKQTAVIAGGCFWGIQAVFQHVKGVISATSGYSGGASGTAEYELVSNGDTGHAESVTIIYDASQITSGQLLRVFFSVAHHPTQLNHQGPDTGTHRSSIFYGSDEQKRIAEAYIAQLEKSKVFSRPIVTQVVPLKVQTEVATLPGDRQDLARFPPPPVVNSSSANGIIGPHLISVRLEGYIALIQPGISGRLGVSVAKTQASFQRQAPCRDYQPSSEPCTAPDSAVSSLSVP